MIDSTGVMELVMFVEKNCGIKVEDHELDPANLDSIGRLARFIERKQALRK
jgi:acyl carrier protein